MGASLLALTVFKMTASFVDVSESETDQFKENAVQKTKKLLHNLESSHSKVG